MKWKNYLFSAVVTSFIVISIAATYYKTVVLQDFPITGISIELLDESTTYAYFVYQNTPHEVEVPTTDYNLLLLAVADTIGIPVAELDPNFIMEFEMAYNELNNGEII